MQEAIINHKSSFFFEKKKKEEANYLPVTSCSMLS